MTWTVILFDGYTYTSSRFQGPHDRHVAMKEATEKFREGWTPDSGSPQWVVALVPGEQPVYTRE